MTGGWIKIYRQLLEKPIWQESTPEQKVILITLLSMANHEKKNGNGKVNLTRLFLVNLLRH
ncbi:hypothetical protein ACLZX5_14425 [Enterococcus faecium]